MADIQGTSSAATPSEGQIQQKLLEIGKRGSLEPITLLEFPAILNCRRVAANSASDDALKRAHIAQLAISTAVADITDGELREAAEIALGIHPDYANMRITAREEQFQKWKKAEGHASYSRDTFKRRRRRAFEHIATFLTLRDTLPSPESHDEPSRISLTAPSPPVADSPRRQDIRDLSMPNALSGFLYSSVELHFDILTALFVSQQLDLYQTHRGSATTVYFSASKRIYNGYIDFLTGWHVLFEQNDTPDISSLLSPKAIAAVNRFGGTARACGPPALSELEELQFRWHAGEWRSHAAPEPLRGNPRLTLYAHDEPTDRNGYPNMYLDAWKPWYRTQVPRPKYIRSGVSGLDINAPRDLAGIAGAAIAVYNTVARDVDWADTYPERVRQSALTELASYYKFDDRAILSAGLSLREHAIVFFERQRQLLESFD